MPVLGAGAPEKPSPAATSANGAAGGDASTAPAPSSATGIPSDYQERLYAHIESFRLYPPQARRERTQGRVQLVFTMSRSGEVLDVRILASSGSALLDQAAIDTILRAQPLPAIPATIADPLEVEMPVEFDLPG